MKILRGLGSLLYTLLIYAGLPLLGWGLDDLSGFFSVPQFLGYSISIAIFGLVYGYQMIEHPESLLAGKGRNAKFVPRQRTVRILVTGLLLGALVFVPFADRRGVGIMDNSHIVRWLGFVLANLGMGLIFWSGLTLGRLYSPEVTIQENHHLITDGPYRSIRHPRYLGGMLQGIGLSLLFRSWIGMVLTFLFFVIILFRIQDEEVLMGKEFGEEWESYRAKSWRLIPGLF
jgi:protein-S-isoprenylcysteine O-methyltransferase Ste14